MFMLTVSDCSTVLMLTQMLMLTATDSCFDVDSDVHVDCDSPGVLMLTQILMLTVTAQLFLC